jgi:hypothetical protein
VEFTPLLEPGIHDISKNALAEHFAFPFESKDKRVELIERFNVLLEQVENIGISFEIWVNGSFVTDKVEPNDIDVAFFFNPADANILAIDKQNILRELADNSLSKFRYNCDVYFLPNNDVGLRSYWRGWFGFTRSETAKGFARITI